MLRYKQRKWEFDTYIALKNPSIFALHYGSSSVSIISRLEVQLDNNCISISLIIVNSRVLT